jgi:hypothetical protein
MRHALLVLLASLSLTACATSSKASAPADTGSGAGDDGTIAAIKKRAAFDLNCTEAAVQVTVIEEGSFMAPATYGARGCDKQATYLERMGTILKQ